MISGISGAKCEVRFVRCVLQVSCRVQRVFDILERQGLADPMDVCCQCDVNRQIYKTLRTIGIHEILYPLPGDSEDLQLKSKPVQHLRSSVTPENVTKKSEQVRQAETENQIGSRPPQGRTSENSHPRHQPRRESLEEARRPQRTHTRPGQDGDKHVTQRRRSVGSQPFRETDCGFQTLTKEWSEYCVFPERYFMMNYNQKRPYTYILMDNHESQKAKVGLSSIVDNYDKALDSEKDVCLAPASTGNRKIEIFLQHHKMAVPKVLPEAPSRKSKTNTTHVRYEGKADDQVKCKGKGSKVREVSFSKVHVDVTSGKETQEEVGVSDLDGRISRNDLYDSVFQSDMHDQDGHPNDDHEDMASKRSDKYVTSHDEGTTETSRRKVGSVHPEITEKLMEPDIVTAKNKKTSNDQLKVIDLLDDASNFIGEETVENVSLSPDEMSSAEEFCKTPTGRRLSWVSGDEVSTTHGERTRTTGSKSGKEKRKDKSREKKGLRKHTAIVMNSESDCSILCRKYLK